MAHPIVDSLPPADQLGRPDGLQGWEDVLHKAELTRHEQDMIKKMQREASLPETVF